MRQKLIDQVTVARHGAYVGSSAVKAGRVLLFKYPERRHRCRSMTFACRSFPVSSMRRRGSAAAFLEWSLTLE
jgi:hypothetical protein